MAFLGSPDDGGFSRRSYLSLARTRKLIASNIKFEKTLGLNGMHKISENSKTGAPIITHVFAAEKGPYGSIWKIYIEAEDPDGEMDRISVRVNQVGYGFYPTDWIRIKPQHRKHLMGFLQWNTFSSKASSLPEWTQISLKISIFDSAGNESNEVTVPFTFESGIKNQYQFPAPFNQEDIPRIGNIMVELYYTGF